MRKPVLWAVAVGVAAAIVAFVVERFTGLPSYATPLVAFAVVAPATIVLANARRHP